MMNNLNDPAKVSEFVSNFKQNNPRNFDEINSQTLQNDAQTKQDNISTTGQLVCLWEGDQKEVTAEQIIEFVKLLNE